MSNLSTVLPLSEGNGRCPVCGSARLQTLLVYPNKGRLLSQRQLTLMGCETCGVAYSAPLPSEGQVAAYYAGAAGWQKGKAGPDEGPEARAVIGRSLERKRVGYRRALQLLRPLLSAPVPGDGPARALDFGCGIGAWLDVLQEDRWETFGIEPGARGAAVTALRHTVLERVPADERFHLVVVNHVFEHLRDPLAVLRELVASLVPGGQVFISVPDLGRLPQHQRFKYVKSDLHMMSYTFSGLRSLLALGGCEVEEHLVNPDWDAWGSDEHARLRVLARKSEQVSFPVEEAPLMPAIESLRAYEEIAEAAQAERRRAKEHAATTGVVATVRRAFAGVARRGR